MESIEEVCKILDRSRTTKSYLIVNDKQVDLQPAFSFEVLCVTAGNYLFYDESVGQKTVIVTGTD